MTRYLCALALFLLIWGALHGVHVLVGGVPADFDFTVARFNDTVLIHALMPAYFLALSGIQWSRTEAAVEALLAQLPASFGAHFSARQTVHYWALGAGALLGAAYGGYEMRLAANTPAGAVPVEIALKVSNAIVWAGIGLLWGWRLRTGMMFARAGRAVAVDLHRLEQLRPVGRMATTDVFVTMGALALMPIQSLSSDFDWAYYESGFIVGITAAIVFLLLPMSGIHRSVRSAKAERLLEINNAVDVADRDDLRALESILAYRDRIQQASEWPMETKVLRRAVAYLVIPPLAWVGAALVEMGVDRFF